MLRISGTVITILIGGLFLVGDGASRLAPSAHAQQMPETYEEIATLGEVAAQLMQHATRVDEIVEKVADIDTAYFSYLEGTLPEAELLTLVSEARRESTAILNEIETASAGLLDREFGTSALGDRMRAFKYEFPLIIEELRKIFDATLTGYADAVGPNPLSEEELSLLAIERLEVLDTMASLSLAADRDAIPASHPNHPLLDAMIESGKQYVTLQKIIHEWQFGEQSEVDAQIIAFHKSADRIRQLEREGLRKLNQMLRDFEMMAAASPSTDEARLVREMKTAVATISDSWDVEMRILANFERQAELYAGYDVEISYDALTPLFDVESALEQERWKVFGDRIEKINEAIQKSRPYFE